MLFIVSIGDDEGNILAEGSPYKITLDDDFKLSKSMEGIEKRAWDMYLSNIAEEARRTREDISDE